MSELELKPPLSSDYFKKQTRDSPNGHKRHRNCVHETSREHRQGYQREKKKGGKKVGSVSQSVSIIQAHIKQLMCMYGIVLSSAGNYKEKRTTPFWLKKKKKVLLLMGETEQTLK